jgi:hypothetical protein
MLSPRGTRLYVMQSNSLHTKRREIAISVTVEITMITAITRQTQNTKERYLSPRMQAHYETIAREIEET